MFRFLAAFAVLAVILCPARGWGQDAELWRLVARSDVIVVGTFDFGEAEVTPKTYMRIPFATSEILFGQVGATTSVRWYSEPSAYSPTVQQLADLSGKLALAFLVHADGENYFADTPAGLASASPDVVNVVRQEVARQAAVLSSWRPTAGTPHDREVRRIIERIASLQPSQTREQQRLFERLEALGPSAVPAIIIRMDDDRPLSTPAISLINRSPDAFEGIRHYGPEVMSEALAAILNQLTGESFGFIYNGATRAERRRSIDGWRVYLDHIESGPAP